MRELIVDQNAQPIRNLCSSPNGAAGANLAWGMLQGNSTGSPTTERAHSGTGSIKFTRLVDGGGLSSAHNPTPYPSIQPGETYSASVWVWPTFATTWRLQSDWRDAARASLTGTNGTLTGTLPANTWNRLTGTFTAPTNLAGLVAFEFRVLPTGSTYTTADFYYLDDVMIVRGSAVMDYSDGDTPGWRWTGTSGRSESVGYPYTLESIAGRPAAWYDARSLLGKGVALPADGTAVPTWTDLSGNGRHLGQSTSTRQPLIRTASPNLLRLEQARLRNGIDTWRAGAGFPAVAFDSTIARPVFGTGVLKATANAAGGAMRIQNQAWGAGAAAEKPAGTFNVGDTAQGHVWVYSPTGTNVTLESQIIQAGGGTPTFAGGGLTAIPANTWTKVTSGVITMATAGDYPGMQIVWSGTTGGDLLYVVNAGLYRTAAPAAFSTPVAFTGGLPTVEFDGNINQMTVPAILGAGRSVYVVHQSNAEGASGSRGIFQITNGGAGGANRYHRVLTTGATAYRHDIHLDDGTLLTFGGTASITVPTVLSSVVGANGASFAMNGSQGISTATPRTWDVPSGGQIQLGMRDSGTSGVCYTGLISAFLVYDTEHNATTRNRIEKWLGAQYGITVA